MQTLRTRFHDERGMTLVEVMAAMVILLIGVLGTLTLVQGSLSSTSRTTAREQATNLARDLVERSRQADYANITYDARARRRCAVDAAGLRQRHGAVGTDRLDSSRSRAATSTTP